jgi:hypothetical protein
LRALLEFRQASRNHRRLRKHERFEKEYALINDSGNNYATLHYYVSRDVQLRQLDAVGYQSLECLDSSGRTLTNGADDANHPSIHYIARRTR